jgi:hypothetical protein
MELPIRIRLGQLTASDIERYSLSYRAPKPQVLRPHRIGHPRLFRTTTKTAGVLIARI